MMATNFGFNPVTEGKRYFISYKNEDAGKVAKIAFRLNEMGVPEGAWWSRRSTGMWWTIIPSR